MKKVVERVQRENDTLKKSSALASQDKVAALEQENQNLKVGHHFMFCVVHIFFISASTYFSVTTTQSILHPPDRNTLIPTLM